MEKKFCLGGAYTKGYTGLQGCNKTRLQNHERTVYFDSVLKLLANIVRKSG